MHAAHLASSDRLQRMLQALSDGQWHTTAELQAITNSMAPATDISELRKNGFSIQANYRGRSATNRKIWEYRWDPTDQDIQIFQKEAVHG